MAFITTGGVPHHRHLRDIGIHRGLILSTVRARVNSYEMPESFRALAKGTPLGIPNIILIAALVAVIIYIFSTTHDPDATFYTIGSNPDAARVAGINVTRTTFMVYVVSGLLCGLAAAVGIAL